MKNYLNGLLVTFMSFILISPSLYAQMPPQWPDEYIGVWRVQESDGSPRYIVLYKDHTCQTTFNPKAHGKWQYDPDQKETRIDWDDDWADILLKQGDVYRNYGYAPGSNPDSKPANVGRADKILVNPFDYVGIWKLTDKQGKEIQVVVNDNASVSSKEPGMEKGKWNIVSDKVVIEWNSGRMDTLFRVDDKPKWYFYAPGKSIDGDPSGTYQAERIRPFLRSDMQAQEINEENFLAT